MSVLHLIRSVHRAQRMADPLGSLARDVLAGDSLAEANTLPESEKRELIKRMNEYAVFVPTPVGGYWECGVCESELEDDGWCFGCHAYKGMPR